MGVILWSIFGGKMGYSTGYFPEISTFKVAITKYCTTYPNRKEHGVIGLERAAIFDVKFLNVCLIL